MKLSTHNPAHSRAMGSSITARIATAGVAAAMALGLSVTAVGSAGAAKMSGVAKATARLDAFLKPAQWHGPTQPLHYKGLAGDKVVYISAADSIPVLHYWSTTIKSLLMKVAGIDMTIVDANSNIANASAGFDQAIAMGAKVIVLQALPPSLFTQKITAAHAAGIKVIVANQGVPGQLGSGTDASVSFDYVKVGQLIGDWFVSQSKGKGKALLVTSNDVPASPAQAQGTLHEVKSLCPKCNVKVSDVQIAQWASGIPTLFQSTINTDPSRKYILPLYDGQSLPGLTAIRTLNAGSKVNVGSFNATEGIVELLKDPKSGLKLDIGGDNKWYAYAAADQIMRVLDGLTPVKNYYVGLRVFTSANAGKLIVGTNQDRWFQDLGYIKHFKALWKP
ncbi:MAG TPA: sugar ABC transporter substrate-binding protein [Acidimicrobiales bacterium]|nr:sugar ABC transporter substrate-binding protein [Acidimicrobiales bacterium]